MKNPCRHCEERHTGCHPQCEKYLAWKKEKDEEREKRLKEKMVESARRDLAVQAIKKTSKSGKEKARLLRLN